MSRLLDPLQGYYWPVAGPQNTMYLPGPLLKACNNELILLELGNSMKADASAKGSAKPASVLRASIHSDEASCC